jgi:diguanylate cyclase (GGDEF)-like protein
MNEGTRDEDQVAILFLDLDDFKKVNDSLGHEVGDKLLVEAARRLRMSVRKGDTVGRLGGDEFIVLLGGIETIDDVQAIVENIINHFRNAFKIDGREFLLTISVGIAMYPGDGNTGSELLRNADSAMYHSKGIGRNTYSFFKDEMNHNVSRRLVLEEQLHGAFERDEFEVLFQPKVSLEDGSLIGAEALVRWHNTALGSVSPTEFIPIAERTGFIVTLGKFVLCQAIGMIGDCQRLFGSSFRMAVNLSPRQFRDPGLVPFIRECLQEKGVSADCLEMEITEGVLMSGHAYIDEAIAALKAMNITLAMDDFGTGYSSLSYLRKYPFDVLKIDRSFIHDITENTADRELVQAGIAMAQGLKLAVVAEGIETEPQLALLRELGCDYGQGFLFGKPVSADKLYSVFGGACLRLVSSD